MIDKNFLKNIGCGCKLFLILQKKRQQNKTVTLITHL